jgi:hypothetical protein
MCVPTINHHQCRVEPMCSTFRLLPYYFLNHHIRYIDTKQKEDIAPQKQLHKR